MKYQKFSFYWKIISSSRAEKILKILFLSFTCEATGVAMVINMISQLQESFTLRRATGSFEISFTKWLRGAKTVQLPVTFSMSCQIFTSILFPSMKNIQKDLPKSRKVMLKNSLKNKKNCLLCRNFISSCKINRTLYGRLGDTNFIFKQFGLVVWYSVMV